MRIGYPVCATNRAPHCVRLLPLRPGEEIKARWSGQVGREDVSLGESRACSVAVDDEGEVALVHIRDERGTRDVRVRRATPKVIGRVCRTSGCRPGIEVHGTGSDILIELDSRSASATGSLRPFSEPSRQAASGGPRPGSRSVLRYARTRCDHA